MSEKPKRQYVWVLDYITPIVYRHKKDALKRAKIIAKIFQEENNPRYSLNKCMINEYDKDLS